MPWSPSSTGLSPSSAARRRAGAPSGGTRPRRRPLHTAQIVVVGFAILIALGTLLLASPMSSASGEWTDPVDALFTATSAVCVTGLAVVDTATWWTPFGKGVILALIQLGGLGIMMLAGIVGLVVARRLTVSSRMHTVNDTRMSGQDVRGVVLGILRTTAAVEAAVFVLLFLRFLLGYGYSPGRAAIHGLFHAVSAFNNAGFALYSDNLVSFVADPWVCLPIAAAIILGGLGFPVILQLRREFARPLHWSMNTKLVLVMTIALLVIGTVYLCAVEWTNPRTLGPLDPAARVLAGFFQSVQTRTAGFNSIDIGAMHTQSWFLMDALMFIGAGPAGTAGGIKVTTFAVLFFIMLTELRGGGAVNIFGKRLSRSIHRQAITVVLMAVAAVFAGTAALLIMTDFTLDKLLFEVISAFATVGLSTGITPELPWNAELVLVGLMFLGRIGPLTLGSAIALQRRRDLYELPKERPAIG